MDLTLGSLQILGLAGEMDQLQGSWEPMDGASGQPLWSGLHKPNKLQSDLHLRRENSKKLASLPNGIKQVMNKGEGEAIVDVLLKMLVAWL